MNDIINAVLSLFPFPPELPDDVKRMILEYAGLVRFGKKATFYVIYV